MSNNNGNQPSSPPSNGDSQDKRKEGTGDNDGRDDPALPTELHQLLEHLPEKARQEIIQLVSYSHHGPLPLPSDFGEYDRIRPGSADDIMGMAKEEQRIKESVLTGRIKNERLAVSVAMAGVIGLIIVSLVAIWQGQPVVASITAIASAALLAIRAIPRRKD